MADITVVAADVVAGTGASFTTGTAGATITAGQTVYLDSGTSTFKLADCDASAATATVVGIALHGSLSGQPLKVHTGGDITLGVTPMTKGLIYVQSATAGGIAPSADLVGGDFTTFLGVAKTAAILTVTLNNSGIQQ